MPERLLTSLSALGIALAPALLKFADASEAPVEHDESAEVLCVASDSAPVHATFRGARIDARLPAGSVVQVVSERSSWRHVAYVSEGEAQLGWITLAHLESCSTDGEEAPPGPDTGRTGPAVGSAGLTIFSVDIGQGDATVVLGPTLGGRRRALVMDAGDRFPSGADIVRNLLQEQGIGTVDYVVLSHFDADHLGGFVTVAGSTSLLWNSPNCDPTPFFPTVAIFDQGLDTNQSKSSEQWRKCVPQIAAQRGVRHAHVQGGDEIGTVLDLGGGARAIIVAGDGFVLNRADRVAAVDTPNERSIALLVSNDQGFDFLVTGDLIGQTAGAEDAQAESALGAALSAAGVDLEVLRTGHHGAANATESRFLGAIRAEAAIISTGDNQKGNYRHPRCKTYQALRDAGVGLVLQTELGNTDCEDQLPVDPVIVNGTIRVDVEGSRYSIRSHGVESPANGGPTSDVSFTCSLSTGCSAGGAPIGNTGGNSCCKTCTNSKPCGNSCIPTTSTCNQLPGCACAE